MTRGAGRTVAGLGVHGQPRVIEHDPQPPFDGGDAVATLAAIGGSGGRIAGTGPDMDPKDRDPANPTPEELRETAASEGLIATEEETDPDFTDDRDPSELPPADVV
jgi:hypothetical protein